MAEGKMHPQMEVGHKIPESQVEVVSELQDSLKAQAAILAGSSERLAELQVMITELDEEFTSKLSQASAEIYSSTGEETQRKLDHAEDLLKAKFDMEEITAGLEQTIIEANTKIALIIEQLGLTMLAIGEA